MSKFSKNNVDCPECGNSQVFTTCQSIIAHISPELKEQVLTGELFVYKCEKCGKSFPITYPCLYHDIEKHLMVYMTPNKEDIHKMNEVLIGSPETMEAQAEQGYVYRGVTTVNELAEKIMIHDMKLDDRIIEVIKMLILFKSGNEGMDLDSVMGAFYYPGKEHKHEILLMFADGRQALVPIDEELIKETADNLMDRINEHTDFGYQFIDIEWVGKVIQ